jgi:hypothetical protein
MFTGHQQNYFVDAVAFALSTIPAIAIALLLIASHVQVRRRVARRVPVRVLNLRADATARQHPMPEKKAA